MIKKERAALFAALLVIPSLASCADAHSATPEPFQGVVEFEERVLAFEVPGRVTGLHVHRGDLVEPSSALASLDDTLERSARDSNAGQLAAARAQVDLVRAGPRPEEVRATAAQLHAARATEDLLAKNLQRERTLLDHGAVPEALVDQAEAELARATAERKALEQKLRALKHGPRSEELRVAESNADSVASALDLHDARLDRYALHAPEPGEVLDVHVEPGEVVAPGTPIVTLADTAHPYADVFVPVPRAGEVQQGARAILRVDGYDQSFTGKVEHVARRTEFTPRFLFSERERPNLVVRVRVRIDDPERVLHAGIPAFVTLVPGTSK